MFDYRPEKRRRDRKVKQNIAGDIPFGADLFNFRAKLREGIRVVEIAGDVAAAFFKITPLGCVNFASGELLDIRSDAVAKKLIVTLSNRNAYYSKVFRKKF